MPKPEGMRFTTAVVERCPAPGDERRGGHDRDVPRRGLDPQDGGRLRDPPGPRRLGRRRLEPQREGLRLGRGVEEPPPRARLPLRLRRRDLPQARLGRLMRERRRDGRHRRERRRLPRGRRRRRGPRRVLGALAGAPLVAEVARAARRPHVRRRRGRRHGRLDRRGVPGGGAPEARRPLLPQRAGQGAQVQAAGGRRDAEGHPCDGVARGGRGQGARGRVRAGGLEAQGGPPGWCAGASPRP